MAPARADGVNDDSLMVFSFLRVFEAACLERLDHALYLMFNQTKWNEAIVQKN
jgi:hypothetical protein